MASVVDWGKLGGRAANMKKGSGSGPQEGKPEWMTISDSAKVRPIGQAVEFVKVFVDTKKGKRSVVVDPVDADKAVALLSAEAGYDVRGSNRFAINVIDRADGRIKILEGGMQIFGFWGKWQMTTEIHPGSKEGYDWSIEAEKTGPKPQDKKYTPIPLKPAPITEQEWALINKKKAEYTLSDIYKSTPLDEVIDKVFGEKSDGGSHSSSSSSSSAEPQPVTGNVDW